VFSDGLCFVPELFRQFFVDLAVEFGKVGFADEGFQDFAFFVDEDGSRVNLRAESRGGSFPAVVGDGAMVDYAILAQHAVMEEGARVIGEETQITVIPEGETVSAASTAQRVG